MLYPIQNEVRNRLDLSGIWDFQPDPAEVGAATGWATGLAAPRTMAVPGSWNEQYADLYTYLGMAWYTRTTYIPRTWQGQRVMLRVGSEHVSSADTFAAALRWGCDVRPAAGEVGRRAVG